MTEKGKRIGKVMAHFGLNKNSFSKEIGMSSNVTIGRILNEDRNPHPATLQKIVDRFPQINYDWLLNGIGDMLTGVPQVSGTSAPDVFTAPLLPLAAQGGTLNDFVVSIKVAECERVVTPIRDVDFVMTVTGDSMAPDYPNGAQVLIKKVDEKAFIEWGRVYVLDTCNGSVIKEVRKGDDGDSVQCYSLNPDPKYQPFAVRFADIYGMYRVLMCMSLK